MINRPQCPYCNGNTNKLGKTDSGNQRYICKDCKKIFSCDPVGICKVCSIRFKKKGRQLYCSDKCNQHAYNKRHQDSRKEIHKRYRDSHKDKVKVWNATARRKLRFEVFALYGSKCNWPDCNWTDHRALQLDHINRASEPQGHRLRGGIGLYREILRGRRNKKDYQLLCSNHNMIKAWENNEFPTGKKRIKSVNGVIYESKWTRKEITDGNV